MSLNISLIQLNGTPKTVKEAIISLLSNEWPLTARQILAKSKNFGFNVSAQAIYKTARQLENEGILKKAGTGYSLSLDWLKKAKEISAKLHETYSQAQQSSQNGNAENSFTFATLYEADMFLLDIALKNTPENKAESPLIMHWSHYWVPLFLSIQEYKKIKEVLLKYKVYGLVRGSSIVDKWCWNFWANNGFNTKTGADVASTSDLLVFKNTIFQIYYPNDLKNTLDELYSKPKKIQDLNVQELFEKAFLKKNPIHITIMENERLAKQLTEQTIRIFEEKRED